MTGLSVKPGVKLTGLRPEVIVALIAAQGLHPSQNIVITSALEGKHMVGSKHYVGQAVDLRIHDLDRPAAIKWRNKLALALGKDYDVVLEDDHLHIEYDCKVLYG